MTMTLLTRGNPKTVKGRKRGYSTAVLHLAPFTLSGRNVCPMATAGCAAACLNTAGRGGIGLADVGKLTRDAVAPRSAIQRARLARTDWFYSDRAAFMLALRREIAAHVKHADRAGLIPCVRLNGTSDLRFERIPVGDDVNLMAAFPRLQFYDYTKLTNRSDLPPNLHLTYSLAETDRSVRDSLAMLAAGVNVAVVLRGAGDSAHPKPFPQSWQGVRLIDGDVSDLRFLDPSPAYVGLRAKGRAKRDRSGFVRDLDQLANQPTERGHALRD